MQQATNFKVEDTSYENDFGTAKEVYDNCMNAGIINSSVNINSNLNTPCSSKQKNSNITTAANGSQKGNSNVADLNKPRKSSFVQKNLELHLSDSQRSKIEAILTSVKELTDTEKLLLYLKLPTREHETPSTTNTKQEQTFAFQWIRNNLEECDNSINLPKHEVYDEYRAFCESESLTRFLSAPDFGKIVKCIYPNVKARRLGTRGNSKYCYNGLRRKPNTMQKPVEEDNSNKVPDQLENVENKKIKIEDQETTCNQTFAAASALVCEWANKLLGRVFETLIGLAKFLVSGSYVSTKSMASFVVMSASEECINKLNSKYSIDALNPSSIPTKSQVIKTENMSPLTSTNFLLGSDRVNIQSNEVNSTSDVQRKSMSSFIQGGSQIVPDMPSSNSDLIGDFSIDISKPVLLGDNSSNPSVSNKMNHKNSLLGTNSKLNQSCSRSTSDLSHNDHNNMLKSNSDGKRRKKRIEQLQSNSPYSKNKLSVQSQYSMKDPNGFNHQSSFSSYPPVPQNGVVNLQMQCNQYINWPSDMVDTPDVDINSFATDTQLDMFVNDQRCHTVPMARTKCLETDQSLTPHLGNSQSVYSSRFKQPHKAKRNLVNMFNNNNTDGNVPGSEFFSNNNSSLQNVPNIMPLSSKPNVERVVPTEPLKNMQGFSNFDMSHQNDDFSGIASNFYHVDGHELLKTCQPSDSWMNDWSNMTMPVMNFT